MSLLPGGFAFLGLGLWVFGFPGSVKHNREWIAGKPAGVMHENHQSPKNPLGGHRRGCFRVSGDWYPSARFVRSTGV